MRRTHLALESIKASDCNSQSACEEPDESCLGVYMQKTQCALRVLPWVAQGWWAWTPAGACWQHPWGPGDCQRLPTGESASCTSQLRSLLVAPPNDGSSQWVVTCPAKRGYSQYYTDTYKRACVSITDDLHLFDMRPHNMSSEGNLELLSMGQATEGSEGFVCACVNCGYGMARFLHGLQSADTLTRAEGQTVDTSTVHSFSRLDSSVKHLNAEA